MNSHEEWDNLVPSSENSLRYEFEYGLEEGIMYGSWLANVSWKWRVCDNVYIISVHTACVTAMELYDQMHIGTDGSYDKL